MKLFKEKTVLLLPVIVLLVTIIFSLTSIPSVNPIPKNLPIAIVNEDQGFEIPGQGIMNRGETIVENVKNAGAARADLESAVKWIDVNNEQSVREGLDDQRYYAAFIIPKDFSQKQASLQTPNPVSPEVQILINQGANTMAAAIAGQMLNQMVDQINNNARIQMMEGFENQGGTMTAQQASFLVTPIVGKVSNVNEVGTHSANGNAPVALIFPLWMASLIGSIVVFLAFKKIQFATKTEHLWARLIQVLVGLVLALIVGYGLVWVSNGWIGLNIPRINETALFIALCYFCFYLMVSSVISWIGLGGVGIFALLFFFGTPLLAIPSEFMSTFYRDWFYTLLPMRFASEGLRELFFFDKGLRLNNSTAVLLWIGSISLIVLFSSVLRLQKNVRKSA